MEKEKRGKKAFSQLQPKRTHPHGGRREEGPGSSVNVARPSTEEFTVGRGTGPSVGGSSFCLESAPLWKGVDPPSTVARYLEDNLGDTSDIAIAPHGENPVCCSLPPGFTYTDTL